MSAMPRLLRLPEQSRGTQLHRKICISGGQDTTCPMTFMRSAIKQMRHVASLISITYKVRPGCITTRPAPHIVNWTTHTTMISIFTVIRQSGPRRQATLARLPHRYRDSFLRLAAISVSHRSPFSSSFCLSYSSSCTARSTFTDQTNVNFCNSRCKHVLPVP